MSNAAAIQEQHELYLDTDIVPTSTSPGRNGEFSERNWIKKTPSTKCLSLNKQEQQEVMKLKNLQKQPSTTSFDEYGRKKKRLVYQKSLHNAEV